MNHNDWLDIDILEDYLDGKLDAKTMHSVEKRSLEDPFVAEALDGLSQSRKRTQSLSLLQKQLQERIMQKPVVEKRWRITSQRLSIAAAAAVLFLVVSVLFWMKQTPRVNLAASKKKVDVNLAPQPAPAAPVVEKAASEPMVAQNIIPRTALPKKAATTVVEEQPQAIVAAGVEKPAIVASSRVKTDTVRPVVAAAAALDPEVIFIAKNKQRENEAKAERLDRETSIVGKADGVQFSPNMLLKGKSGVLINGVVYEKPGGQPLPGAIVRIPGTDKATTTNAKGEFSLSADSGAKSLSIGYIGFASKEVPAKGNQLVSVGLEHDSKALNEVVVVRTDKTQALKPTPMPADGWASFTSYLNANNRLSPNGTKKTKEVRLTFTVKKDGALADIKVVKGLTKAENDEAIRLIKNGPKWVLPPNSKRRVEITVSF